MYAPGLLAALAMAVNPFLVEGRARCDALQWEQAEASLRLAVAHPESTRDERRAAHDLLARALTALGRLDDAQAAFAALLVRDPAAPEPSGAAPKLLKLFSKAKESLYPPRWARLSALPALEGELAAEVADPWRQVAAVELRDGERAIAFTLVDGVARGKQLPGCRGCVLLALDSGGVMLAMLALPDTAPAPVVAAAPAEALVAPAPAPAPVSTVPRWLKVGLGVLGGAALVTAGALTASAADTSARAGHAEFGSDKTSLDRQARGQAIAAWSCGGAGLVLVGAAVVLTLATP